MIRLRTTPIRGTTDETQIVDTTTDTLNYVTPITGTDAPIDN
jgi:hypothetical protein